MSKNKNKININITSDSNNKESNKVPDQKKKNNLNTLIVIVGLIASLMTIYAFFYSDSDSSTRTTQIDGVR